MEEWRINKNKDGVEIYFGYKPSSEILALVKENGFRWSRHQEVWYGKDTEKRREIAKEVTGIEEPIIIEKLSYAEQMELKKERAKGKIEYCQDKALQNQEKAEEIYNIAKKKASVIPFGQPILVGHHSEGRDRRYRAGIERTYSKSFETLDKANYYNQKAEASQNFLNSLESARTTHNRIVKLETELRKLEKNKKNYPNSADRYNKLIDETKEKIDYWKNELRESGTVILSDVEVKIKFKKVEEEITWSWGQKETLSGVKYEDYFISSTRGAFRIFKKGVEFNHFGTQIECRQYVQSIVNREEEERQCS